MKLVWADSAISDLEAIRAYIARDSAFYASRFVGRLVKAATILEDYPELGAVVAELPGRDIRELVFHNYRVLYRLGGNRVSIVAVVHAGRDLRLLESKPWEIS